MNAARDLAATGTPGLWLWSDFTPTTQAKRRTLGDHSVVHGAGKEIALLRGFADERHPDAEKIRRAVNALPAIADLLDALADSQMLQQARQYRDDPAAPNWPVEARIVATWDAVAAALTGETP